MKNYFKKFVIMFVMLLSCGFLYGNNAFASETLKPSATGLGTSGTWTVNSFTNVYGASQTPNSLLDGVRGKYNDSNSFYFYEPQYYIDVTLNQQTNIWAISASNDPADYHTLVCQKWNGSLFEDYANYIPTKDGSNWDCILLLQSRQPLDRYTRRKKYAA